MGGLKTNRLAVIIDSVIGNYPMKTSRKQIIEEVNLIADKFAHTLKVGWTPETLDLDSIDPKAYLSDEENLRVSGGAISSLLNDVLVEEGILEKSAELIRGRGGTLHFYQVPTDYEVLHKILKIYYDLNDDESAFLGLRLLKSEYGKKIINMDFVEWVTKKLIYAPFDDDKENILLKNILLKMFQASPRTIYETLEFVTNGMDKIINSHYDLEAKRERIRTQIIKIVFSVGLDSLEYGRLGLDSPLNIHYKVSLKLIEEKEKEIPKDFPPFIYTLAPKKGDYGEDLINTSLNIRSGTHYADAIAFHMPPLTQELQSKTQGQLYQEW